MSTERKVALVAASLVGLVAAVAAASAGLVLSAILSDVGIPEEEE